jgi:hypothetical protein
MVTIENRYDAVIAGPSLMGVWAAIQMAQAGQRILLVDCETKNKPFVSTRNGQLVDFENRIILHELAQEEGAQTLSDAQFQIVGRRERFKVDGSVHMEPEYLRGLNYIYRGHDARLLLSPETESAHKLVQDLSVLPVGKFRLFETWVRKAESLGVTLIRRSGLSRLFLEKQHLVGVQVEGDGKMVSTRKLLISSDLAKASTLIHQTAGGAFSSRQRDLPTALGWKFSIGLSVQEEAIPAGAPRSFVIADAYGPTIEVEWSSPSVYGLSDSGQRLIFLRTTLPLQHQTLDREYQRKIAQRLFAALADVFPFLEYNLIRMLPDVRDHEQAEQQDLPEIYPFQELDQIPYELLIWSPMNLKHWVQSSVWPIGPQSEEEEGVFSSRALVRAFIENVPVSIERPV